MSKRFGNLIPQILDGTKKIESRWSKYKIERYGGKGQIALKNTNPVSEGYKNKNYCVLIFLKDSQKIEPFKIDKTGFGTGAAWMCAEDISRVRI